MDTLRIFISSPGDVPEERERARQVVQGLNKRYARHFSLVPVVWEEMPLTLDTSFQAGIDLVLSADTGIDIAVFILWSRLGSPLGPLVRRPDGREFRSGTERELEMMLEARVRQGGRRPQILAYARDDEGAFAETLRGRTTPEKEAAIQQKRLVEGFIREQFHDAATGTNLRAYHTYARPQTFGERLRVHLQEILDGLSAGVAGRPAWDIDRRGPPFLGLESFRFEHAEVFFGREDEVSEARLRLAAAARRGTAFLLVGGGSGTGKSSLAAAGLLPEVVAHETDDHLGRWLSATITPAALAGDPAAGMAGVLTRAVPGLAERVDPADFRAALADGPAAAVRLALLPALKAGAGGSGGLGLVLLVDQLEELFTDPRFDEPAREQVAAILAGLATSGRVWVVATLRGDFYARMVACEGLRRLKSDGSQLDLGPPAADALRRMIESPALLAGLTYEQTGETTLADRILRDVSGQAELLPLLEDLLRGLFEARSPAGVLTVAAYESLGGIGGALERRAEASLASLSADHRAAFPDVLRRLVALGEGGETSGLRRRVPLESFAAGSAQRAVVERLVSDRLATASAGRDGVAEVAIAHEAILRLWPRAAAWIRENLEFLRLRDRLSARMEEDSPLSAADPLVPPARAALDARPDAFEPELAAYVIAQLAAIDEEKRQQVRRRRALVAVAAATLLAVSLGGLALQARAARQRREAEAAGAVAALERAGSSQIEAAAAAATRPEIAPLSRPLLERAFAGDDAAADPAKKLRAAVGLVRLPAAGPSADWRSAAETGGAGSDPVTAAWQHLAESLLAAEPAELAVIRAALAPQQARFVELFWQRARGEERGERLRAAAALAAYDPRGEGWPAIAPTVAGDLVAVPAVHLADWLAALAPVRRVLVPALVPIFADPARREVERSLAADILSDYAADDPAVLADLAMTAEPEQFPAVARQVEARFAEVAPLLGAEIARSLPDDLPAADPARETLGIRQAKAAAVLVRFSQPERVWPLFVHSPDPRVRSYLIHFLGPFGASGEPVAERLFVEPDVSARRGLVLALGELLRPGAGGAREAAAAALRERLVPDLRELFATDPDPGLHAAAAWTLRQCGDAEWLAARREAWRGADPEKSTGPPPPRLEAVLDAFSRGDPRRPRWFVNSQGQSFVAVPGPVEFLMGSPETEAGRYNTEHRHRRRIGRSFAIAAAPLMLGDYERLVGGGRYGKGIAEDIGPRFVRAADLPVMGLSWFMAAQYCNALSEAEGIPETEWVYEEAAGGGMALAEGWLERTGYRLPTEAEWEYASRAGATTSRFYGETAALLGSHAWYLDNSALDGQSAPWPVGQKKPNDLGLSDALGNVWNWCQEEFERYPQAGPDRVVSDDEVARGMPREIVRENHRVLRGCSFYDYGVASNVRSGNRNYDVPTYRSNSGGLRVARTLPPVPFTPLPDAGGGDADTRAPAEPD